MNQINVLKNINADIAFTDAVYRLIFLLIDVRLKWNRYLSIYEACIISYLETKKERNKISIVVGQSNVCRW